MINVSLILIHHYISALKVSFSKDLVAFYSAFSNSACEADSLVLQTVNESASAGV